MYRETRSGASLRKDGDHFAIRFAAFLALGTITPRRSSTPNVVRPRGSIFVDLRRVAVEPRVKDMRFRCKQVSPSRCERRLAHGSP
jgi:hypothetical protein